MCRERGRIRAKDQVYKCMNVYFLGVNNMKQLINNYFEAKEPWQIVTITSTTILATVWLWNFVFQDESLVERAKKQLFSLRNFIPAIRNKIDQELDKINQTFEQETLQRIKDIPFIVKLPEKSLEPKEILERIKKCVQLGDYDWRNGKVSGAIYRVDINLLQLMGDIYSIASYTNPLHPDIFPGICKMEAEVVRIVCNLFHGDEDSCGTMTSGGTESILLACKTYRDYARNVKGIKNPEIVMPITAHSAFDKAAQYLKLKVRSVPVNQHSYTACIKSMEKAITRNTIMYAYAPKGSSLILYRNKKLRHYQYTITTDWPGGIYGSPTVSGSRAGGIIATCWATLLYFGYNEYIESTRKIIETTKYIEQRLRKLDGIFIFGTPATSVIALGSNDFHIYKLSEALNVRGWNLNTLQFPCGIHLCVTYVHTQLGVADQFLNDVETELSIILKNPDAPVDGKFAIYGMSQSIPDRSIVGDFAKCFLDSIYFTPGNKTMVNNGSSI
ncbi:sphingosine-1-phosphate lyase isoform X3 [Bombus huntii]|uniref:sphingosine-1-phosphate lyase isoform X3 n=1 Tax=Bombus huntii TaxID=85661 RepID=UPI0021AACF11|nr:sphingosine-1-phosphate lyase isoform X3 [Bombus huntii]